MTAVTTNQSSRKKQPVRRRRGASAVRASAAKPAGIGRSTRGKIMVTGAAGALAQHVMAELKEHYDIVGVEFRGLQATYPDTVDYALDFNKRTFEDVFRAHDFSGIIHLGRIRSSQLSRGQRYSANVTGTSGLVQLARKYGVEQVVALSTYHVYGADPTNPSLIDEGYPLKAAALSPQLADAVELENLLNIQLYRYPELNITVLRACNIAGPGVSNTVSQVLSQPLSPCLTGFSPLMQFIHVEDMADAIVRAFECNQRGIYNVAPDDYIAYQDALLKAGCRRVFLPSVPPALARGAVRFMGRFAPPDYLINFFKYPVIIDGSRFAEAFDYTPRFSIDDVLGHYRSARC